MKNIVMFLSSSNDLHLRESLYDSSTVRLRPLSMSDLVNKTIKSRNVHWLDIAYNGVIASVGIALVAFVTTSFVLTWLSYGARVEFAALYSILSLTGIGGILVSSFSLKSVIELSKKKLEVIRERRA